jgi:hypothetical protein
MFFETSDIDKITEYLNDKNIKLKYFQIEFDFQQMFLYDNTSYYDLECLYMKFNNELEVYSEPYDADFLTKLNNGIIWEGSYYTKMYDLLNNIEHYKLSKTKLTPKSFILKRIDNEYMLILTTL